MSDLTSRDFRRPAHHEFYKLLRDVCPNGSQPFYVLFEDFLTLASTALIQPTHKMLTGAIDDGMEAEYLRTVRKYDKERAKNFSAAIATLILSLETELHDFLGDVYGSTMVADAWAGQFFTPWDICRTMAKLTLDGAAPPSRGYGAGTPSSRPHRLTVHEPAVGGGAMLLAVAVELRERKFAPWHWWFDATDVDRRCAQMAYIQLTLAGAPGVVRHGNSLSLEQWSAWPTATGAIFPHRYPKTEKVTQLPPPPKPGQMYFELAA